MVSEHDHPARLRSAEKAANKHMEYHTLVFTPWMSPHRIVPWRKAIDKYLVGSYRILESYDGVSIATPNRSFDMPCVAMIVNNVPAYKKGVKFSRVNVYTRDNYTCQYCRHRFPRKQLNYDHVIPRRQGGQTKWENIVTSCIPCNDKKRDRTPKQAGMRLLREPVRPKSLPLMMPAISMEGGIPEIWEFYLQGQGMMMEAAG